MASKTPATIVLVLPHFSGLRISAAASQTPAIRISRNPTSARRMPVRCERAKTTFIPACVLLCGHSFLPPSVTAGHFVTLRYRVPWDMGHALRQSGVTRDRTGQGPSQAAPVDALDRSVLFHVHMPVFMCVPFHLLFRPAWGTHLRGA